MARPPSAPGANGHKKALLQKLMDNLLSKPGRSMHEIINGVKSAIGAYKNYSKEWDNLQGLGGTNQSVSGGGGNIQNILKEVQAKKASQDGGGGPGMQPMPQQAPQAVAPQTVNPPANGIPPMGQMPNLIAGQPQTSTFNRPAPVNQLGVWGH